MPLASIVVLVAVPRHPFDTDGRDVAAEATEAFDQGHVDAGACRSKCRGKACRARADDEHIGLVDDVDLASRLGDACRTFVGFDVGAVAGLMTPALLPVQQPVGERSLLVHLPFTRPTLGVNFDLYG